MVTHLQREMSRLSKRLLELTAVVKNAVEEAVASVARVDAVLARKVRDGDQAIDQTEVDIEEDCLKLLALYQPVATDLRFIIAAMKINNDIERVGDLAVNIAERALCLSKSPPAEAPFDFADISQKALGMLSRSLEALLRQDPQLAREVRALDNEVDALNRGMHIKISDAIREHPAQLDRLLNYLSVSRHLERIADCATNIAEDVIYLTEGHIVRHQPINLD